MAKIKKLSAKERAEREKKLKWEYGGLYYTGMLTKDALQKQRMLTKLAFRIDKAIDNISKEVGSKFRLQTTGKGQFTPMALIDMLEEERTPNKKARQTGGMIINDFMDYSKKRLSEQQWEIKKTFGKNPPKGMVEEFNEVSKNLAKAGVAEVHLGDRYLGNYAHERAESLLPWRIQLNRERIADVFGNIALKDVMDKSKDPKVKAEIKKSFDEIKKVKLENLPPDYQKGIKILKDYLNGKISRKEALKRAIGS